MDYGNTNVTIVCFSIVANKTNYCIIMTNYEKDIKERGPSIIF